MTRDFSSLEEIHFHHRCILTLKHIITSHCPSERNRDGAGRPGGGPTLLQQVPPSAAVLLCSAGTDGRVAVWQVDLRPVWVAGGERQQSNGGVGGGGRVSMASVSEGSHHCSQPAAVSQPHQSGVNDMAIHRGIVSFNIIC